LAGAPHFLPGGIVTTSHQYGLPIDWLDFPRQPPWPDATPSPLSLDRPRDRPGPPRSPSVITCDREKENKQKRLAYPSSLSFDIKNSVQIISITSPSTGKVLSRDVVNHSE